MPVYGIGADVYAPSKKLQLQEENQIVTHAAYEQFSPQISDSRQWVSSYVGPTYVIDSTGTVVSKKASTTAENEPDIKGTWETPQNYSQAQEEGGDSSSQTNWTLIALLATAGILGTAYLVKKKR